MKRASVRIAREDRWIAPNAPPIYYGPRVANFTVPEFIIGVDSQPEGSFNKWKNRGINTLVRIPSPASAHNNDTWVAAAQAAGMYQIRRPRDGSADDGDVPGLIAWSLRDEPDLNGDPAELTISQGYALRDRNPDRPVFLNFTGGVINGHQGNVPDNYYRMAERAGDWICNDFYPVAGWDRPEWIHKVAGAVDYLREIVPSKPQFAYIECSDQNLPFDSFRAATPGEMRVQIWQSVIAGVSGIIYFPIRLGSGSQSFSFDGVQHAGLEDEMIEQNATLKALGPVLLTERNPSGMSATSSNGSLDIGWRQSGSSRYVIAVNTSSSSITNAGINLNGFGGTSATVYGEGRTVNVSGGVLTDSFGAYEKHVYVINS